MKVKFSLVVLGITLIPVLHGFNRVLALKNEAVAFSFPTPTPPPQASLSTTGRLTGPGLRFIHRRKGLEEILEFERWLTHDKQLGVLNQSSSSARHQSWENDTKLYDVEYRFDSWGRRLVPHPNPNRKRRHFVALLGCSVTFGYGISAADTQAALLAQKNESWQVYNYGITAAGPHNTLALLESRSLRPQIPEERGIAVYSLIEDQIPRIIGSSYWMAQNPFMPYYILENGSPARHGNFAQDRPWTSAFYRYQRELSWLGDFVLPLFYQHSGEQLTCAVLKQSAALFESEFPGSKFYVSIPGTETPAFTARMKDCFQREKISYLEQPREEEAIAYLREMVRTEETIKIHPLFVPYDDHPSGLLNRRIADRLAGPIAAALGQIQVP